MRVCVCVCVCVCIPRSSQSAYSKQARGCGDNCFENHQEKRQIIIRIDLFSGSAERIKGGQSAPAENCLL